MNITEFVVECASFVKDVDTVVAVLTTVNAVFVVVVVVMNVTEFVVECASFVKDVDTVVTALTAVDAVFVVTVNSDEIVAILTVVV